MDDNEKLLEAMVQNANNFGAFDDLYHPEYGKLVEDGKLTESGKEFFNKHKEYFEDCYEQN